MAEAELLEQLEKAKGELRTLAYETAIETFSLVLLNARRVPNSAVEAAALCGRSGAFAGLAAKIRSIPAAMSEQRALFGADPLSLAALALKDADAATALRPGMSKAWARRGRALTLLERFLEARAAYAQAMELAPEHAGHRRAAADIDALMAPAAGVVIAGASAGGPDPSSAAAVGDRFVSRGDDLDCQLCLRLLYEPTTTPCGHTFCRSCLRRALDFSPKCPSCRAAMLGAASTLPISVTLRSVLERCFFEETEARRREEAAASAVVAEAAGTRRNLPLFVMDVLLPGQIMRLNVFEPRYRLMIRRCLESDRRFGLIGLGEDRRLLQVGTECEIADCEPLPDGRFSLEVRGRRRVRLDSLEETDGYRTANVTYFDDDADTMPPEDTGDVLSIEDLAAEVDTLARSWLEALSQAAGPDGARLVAQATDGAGPRPADPRRTPERTSFWAACLLPLADGEKLRLMETQSTRERLSRIQAVLRRPVDPRGCAIA